jgi:hypothetical protein
VIKVSSIIDKEGAVIVLRALRRLMEPGKYVLIDDQDIIAMDIAIEELDPPPRASEWLGTSGGSRAHLFFDVQMKSLCRKAHRADKMEPEDATKPFMRCSACLQILEKRKA